MEFQICSQFQGCQLREARNYNSFKRDPHNTEIFRVLGTTALLAEQEVCLLKINNFLSYFLIL